MLPPQLGPPLHVQHAFLPASINTTEPGSPSPRTPPPPSRGVKSQPAKGGQFPPAPTPREGAVRTPRHVCAFCTRCPDRCPGPDFRASITAICREKASTATGIRTRVSAVRGRRPSPLDDSGREVVSVAKRARRGRVDAQLLTCSALPAAVVKLVNTRRSGRRALTGLGVRVPSAASGKAPLVGAFPRYGLVMRAG